MPISREQSRAFHHHPFLRRRSTVLSRRMKWSSADKPVLRAYQITSSSGHLVAPVAPEVQPWLLREAVALLKRSPATFRAAYEGTLEEGREKLALRSLLCKFWSLNSQEALFLRTATLHRTCSTGLSFCVVFEERFRSFRVRSHGLHRLQR